MTLKNKILIILGSVLLLLVVLMAFPRFSQRLKGGLSIDASAAQRLVSWQKGFFVFKNSPLLGVGFDNYRIAQEQLNLIQVYSPDGGRAGAGADSSLLLVLATTGVIGLVIFSALWGVFFKNIIIHKTSSHQLLGLFIAFLVASQFINSLFYSALMVWYFSLMGLGWE